MKKLTAFFLVIVMYLSAYGQETSETAIGRQAPTEKLNIVFFLVDDLGWTDVGYNGSTLYETPNIDQLAGEGVQFSQAYAASHVCSPTRASIMTGKYPARNNLTDWLPGRREYMFQQLQNAQIAPALSHTELTLAEALKAAGYSTAIFGKWHLSDIPFGPGPLEHGFDVSVPTKWNRGSPRNGYYPPFHMEGLEGQEGDYLTDRLTAKALKYIDRNREHPFFLYLSHFAVHDPIQPPPELVEKYKRKLEQRPSPEGPAYILEGNPDAADPLSRARLDKLRQKEAYQGYSVLPHRTVKIKQHQDNPQFAAMVESMDESLGRVRAKLEELGIADNTIIIFFSDNGGMSAANFGGPHRIIPESKLDKAYSTSNLPLRGGKGWLYEGGIREPMIVKWPGHGTPGRVVEEPVISTDFYPSILEMLGLQSHPGQHVDGESFVGLLEGRQEELDRPAIYWHFPQYSNHGMQSPGGAVRSGSYKLLEYYENNSVQLFNLAEDPGEQHDLSGSSPEKVQQLRNMLHDWRKRVDAQMPEPNPRFMKPMLYDNFFD